MPSPNSGIDDVGQQVMSVAVQPPKSLPRQIPSSKPISSWKAGASDPHREENNHLPHISLTFGFYMHACQSFKLIQCSHDYLYIRLL